MNKFLRNDATKAEKSAPLCPADSNKNTCAAKFVKRVAALMQFMVVCAAAVYLLIVSGVVESRILPLLSERWLGVRISFRVDSWNPLCIQELRIRQPGAAPLIQADALILEHNFPHFPATFRLNRLSVMGMHVVWDDQNSNHDFLLPFLPEKGDHQGGGGNAASWIPRRIAFRDLSIHVVDAGKSAACSGLDAEVFFDALDRFRFVAGGTSMQVYWHDESHSNDRMHAQGEASASFVRDRQRFEMSWLAAMPDFWSGSGQATFLATENPSFEILGDYLDSSSPLPGEIISRIIGTPVFFSDFHLAPVECAGTITEGIPAIDHMRMEGTLRNLRIGEPNVSWFSGDVQASAADVADSPSQVQWTLTFDEGQQLSGILAYEEETGRMRATLSDWTRKRTADLWPERYASFLSYLPEFRTMSSVVECRLHKNVLKMEGNVSLAMPGERRPEMQLAGEWHFDDGALEGHAQLAMNEGRLKTNLSRAAATPLEISCSAEKLSVADAFALLGVTSPQPVHAFLDGTSAITENAKGYGISFRLLSPSLQYAGRTAPEELMPFILEGQSLVSKDFSDIRVESLACHLGDATRATASALRFHKEQKQLKGQFSVASEIAPVSVWLGMDDLWGEVEIDGALSVKNATSIRIDPLRIVFDPLGYDAYSIPYGEKLLIEAPMHYDMKAQHLVSDQAVISLGEFTSITADALTVLPDGSFHLGNMAFKTDFAPLVAKRYLESAEGFLEVTIQDAQYNTQGVTASADYKCHAAHLVLPEALADMRNIELEGSVSYANEFSGEGTLRIGEMMAAGVSLKGIAGLLRARGNQLVLEETKVDLFGGGVILQAALAPLESGTPTRVSGEVRNVDLTLFTQEYDPPSLILTGRVNGVFSVGFSINQLQALEVDLEAKDGFSMNRDMVEQLLLSQYMGDIGGSRQIGRVVQSVIGEAPQRAFDRAAVKLGLEEGRITGYIKLESGALNLTVDVKADPLALLESLKARQQEKMQ